MIGEILPLALGIAVSPIPIIAAILMLLSPRAKGTSVGFLLGWVVGIVVAVTVFTLLAAELPASDDDASNPTGGLDQDRTRRPAPADGRQAVAWSADRRRRARRSRGG